VRREKERDQKRNEEQPWRAWYHRYPWTGDHGLERMILRRDPICMMCERAPSTVADHIIPHKGDWSRFVDEKNLQGLCYSCHGAKTANEDGGFGREPVTAK